jgi:HEAT repeat protein
MRIRLAGVLTLVILMVTSAMGADVNDLVAKLKNKDSDVRRSAAKDLAGLGEEAKPAVPALTKALSDKDLFVRRFAAEALGAIGPDAKSAVPALALAMNDGRKEMQLAAVDALGKIGPASIKPLTNVVKDTGKDGVVRRKAAQGLAKIGLQARGAVPTLATVLKTRVKGKGKGKANEDDIRADVAITLGAIATPEDTVAIEALKSVIEGKQRNRELKKAATDALRKITGEAPSRKKKKKNQD